MKELGSIASGDVNNDGWQDILIGTSNGIHLYVNTGAYFKHVKLPSSLPSGVITIATLVDMDNNGFPDIVYDLAGNGVFVSYNINNKFGKPIRLSKNNKDVITDSIGFGDIDRNKNLDIVLGLHGLYFAKHKPTNDLRDSILWGENNKSFIKTSLSGLANDTVVTLISDINGDNYLDILNGNDVNEPDNYFWGSKNGVLTPWNKSDIPNITEYTMSIDSADINNDLMLDTFHGGIAYNPVSGKKAFEERKVTAIDPLECSEVKSRDCELSTFRLKIRSTGVGLCDTFKKDTQLDCIASVSFNKLYIFGNQFLFKNKYLIKNYPDIYFLSQTYNKILQDINTLTEDEIIQRKQKWILPSITNTNLLYIQDKNGTLHEKAKVMGVSLAGLSMNAKFSDLDGDEFQDLFVVNGSNLFPTDTENIWFKNIHGKKFQNESKKIGLNDFSATQTYVYSDYDNDGDLDIITFNGSDKLLLYKNSNNHNNHLQIELEDHKGNRSGIGSKIIIYYGKDREKHQVRELKASGGYHSFDAPIAHFGLGNHKSVESIEVIWSTGEKQVYNGVFESGKRYKIGRE